MGSDVSKDLDELKGSGESTASLRNAFKAAKSGEKKLDWSTYDLNHDDDAHFDIDSEEGQKRVAILKDQLDPGLVEQNPALIDFLCYACLNFRNGDLETAAERVNNYLVWRVNMFGSLQDMNLNDDVELRTIIDRNIFNLVKNIDREGRAAMCVRIRNMDPSIITPKMALKAWHFTIMLALKDKVVQKKGIFIISDMMGASFGNLDSRIPKAVMGAISRAVPVRVFKVLICRPLWITYIALPVVKMFISTKLAERINIAGDPSNLSTYGVDMTVLPTNLKGSNSAYDYQAFVQEQANANVIV